MGASVNLQRVVVCDVSHGLSVDAERTQAALVVVDDDVAFAVEGQQLGTVEGVGVRRIQGPQQVPRVGVDQYRAVYTQKMKNL